MSERVKVRSKVNERNIVRNSCGVYAAFVLTPSLSFLSSSFPPHLGHVPHSPTSSSLTIGPSISSTLTLPPSDIRYGLISSSTASTLSRVKSRGPSSSSVSGDEGREGVSGSSNGDIISLRDDI